MLRNIPIPAVVLAVMLVGGCSDSTPAAEEAVAAEDLLGASEATAVEQAPAPERTPAPTNEPASIDGITNERLSFAPGTSSAIVEGSITGYETIDYLLNVRDGQPMNISMTTPNSATYFNVLEPGETEVAVFNGSTGENQFEGITQKSGDYRIRVYMMRSAARREEQADYRLEVIVSP